jgi:hypothetical protein
MYYGEQLRQLLMNPVKPSRIARFRLWLRDECPGLTVYFLALTMAALSVGLLLAVAAAIVFL